MSTNDTPDTTPCPSLFPNGPDLEHPAIELDMYAWAWNQAGAPQEVLDAIGNAAAAIRRWRGVVPADAPVS